MLLIKDSLIFTEDCHFEPGSVVIEGDKIASIILDSEPDAKDKLSQAEASSPDHIISGNGQYLIPGLMDTHFHGCVGYDFCDGTPEALKAMAEYELSNGVTSICPASMTLSEEVLLGIFANAKTFCETEGSTLCGINMEGPFLCESKKGAQNAAFLHKADIDMFKRCQETSGNLIKLVTIAPEEPGAMEFIEALKDDVILSLGHTSADFDTATEAFQKGASHATHLYNAMPAFSHRAPGVIGAACDAAAQPGSNLFVELICDGIHLHPSCVRTTFSMFGDDHIVLISDSMSATGMTDGEYALGGQKVFVKGNLATLENGTLAGSATNLMDCLRTAVTKMHIPLESAVKCATANPAKSIGLYDSYGSITPGKYANLVMMDQELHLNKIILKGAEI